MPCQDKLEEKFEFIVENWYNRNLKVSRDKFWQLNRKEICRFVQYCELYAFPWDMMLEHFLRDE